MGLNVWRGNSYFSNIQCIEFFVVVVVFALFRMQSWALIDASCLEVFLTVQAS